MYRDILLSNNERAPSVQAQVAYGYIIEMDAVGENVLEAAYEAWNATQPSDTPLDPTPGQSSCGGFATGKHGVPIGGLDNENKSLHKGDSPALRCSHSSVRRGRSTPVEQCVQEINWAILNLREKCEQSDLMVGAKNP